MELEEYFHLINKVIPMKNTSVHFSIADDNNDLDYPNTSYSMNNEYDGHTWLHILEDVIKILEASYGYNIRNNVYYATNFPNFDPNGSPAPGRELDRKLFLKLLAENPDLDDGHALSDMPQPAEE